ncbi:hypothetical protein Cgig2_024849 [Carnegiea gigantea]|uniref:serine C-palmitoyltransferase n=1 Tax=Carnegiea gigantea TaxID=171969 RepID=A0A9Q1KDM2_9CARY|nr:hypothetical protein Cgig2_024849 [Carnegiea gigantea]
MKFIFWKPAVLAKLTKSYDRILVLPLWRNMVLARAVWSSWELQIQYFTHMGSQPIKVLSQPSVRKAISLSCKDEGVHWGIQNGLHLSRSTIVCFKHNDMASLKSTLEKVTVEKKQAKEIRRYIVIEALYQNSGQIAPLDEIIRLKEKYRFRLLMDESNSFGVLGHSGRGLTEYHGVPKEDSALEAQGSLITSIEAVSGYVFSASLPPYLASAAISAFDVLGENSNPITKLKENVELVWAGLSSLQGLKIVSNPHSPIVFLKLKNFMGSLKSDLQLLEDIADQLLKEHNVFAVVSTRSTLDKCPLPVGIRLFISAGHSESDLEKVCESLKTVVPSLLNNHR